MNYKEIITDRLEGMWLKGGPLSRGEAKALAEAIVGSDEFHDILDTPSKVAYDEGYDEGYDQGREDA